MKQAPLLILPLLFFAAALPGVAQQNCSSVTVVKTKSVTDQVVTFLADQKVSIAAQAIGFVAKRGKNAEFEAIGDALSLVQVVADYIQKQTVATSTNLQLCPAPPGISSPGGSSFAILGMRPDIQNLMGSGWNRSLGDLLKPYQSTGQTIPDFKLPTTASQFAPGSNNPGSGDRFPSWMIPSTIRTDATVSGEVLDQYGNGVNGAVVSLVANSIATAQPQWRMTNENGTYSFTAVPGPYSISARLSGGTEDRELRSGTQIVNLSTANPSNVELYLRPLARAVISQQLSPEEESMIVDFVAAADQSETQAAFEGNSSYLRDFYAGPALDRVLADFVGHRRSATVSRLESGRVQHIRYLPAASTIQVDTIEVWSEISYDPSTGEEISRQVKRQEPQTISIRQTAGGWYITNVQFQY